MGAWGRPKNSSVERSDDGNANLGGGGETTGVVGYHADALTYALIACTGSPSCSLSSSVALVLLNSNSATCFENKKGKLSLPFV